MIICNKQRITLNSPKSNSSKKIKMSDNLPDEVITEILCRLPLKSIVQCTSVCKSWNKLIKNPEFILTHCNKTLISNKNQGLFLHRFTTNPYEDCKYSLRFDNQNLDEYLPLKPPFQPSNTYHVDVVGSCKGLICLFQDDFSTRYGYRIILWNPSIRKSFLLPLARFMFVNYMAAPCCRYFVGLGFDSRTHDYKVLRIMNPHVDGGMHFRTELYSLNSNSWKDISDIYPNYSFGYDVRPVFMNDALHWAVTVPTSHNHSRIKNFSGSLVAVFDCRNEVFRQISLPECLANTTRSSSLTVKAFGESTIAVVHRNLNNRNESDIWVMKEYGVVASWVKLATLHCGTRSEVLEFRENGEVLIQFRRVGLASWDIRSQCLSIFKDYRTGNSQFYRYVESLALLHKGDDARDATYETDELEDYTWSHQREPKRTRMRT